MAQDVVNAEVVGKDATWLRQNGWKPHLQVYDMNGNVCELISYPYDQNGVAVIKVRTTVGDPMSMITKPCAELFVVMTEAIVERQVERNQGR